MDKDPEQTPEQKSLVEKASAPSPLDIETQSTSEQNYTRQPILKQEGIAGPEHPDSLDVKKKFSTYFKEFLMIFLAVTLGFFAENLREHFSKSQKEEGYVRGFVDGLKSDTGSINSVIIFNNEKIKGLDSLIRLTSQDMSSLENRKTFYALSAKYLANYLIFKANDITMQQLRYAGDLRLIRKNQAADSLVSYDTFSTAVHQQGQTTVDMFMEISNLMEQTIDYSQWLINDTPESKMSFPIRDQQKLQWLFNKIILYRAVLDFYTNAQLPENKLEAKKLLLALIKRYDLTEHEKK